MYKPPKIIALPRMTLIFQRLPVEPGDPFDVSQTLNSKKKAPVTIPCNKFLSKKSDIVKESPLLSTPL